MVFVQHALGSARRHVADGIGDKAGYLIQFGQLRQYLQQQRIACIAMTHAGDEAARHAQCEAGVGGRQAFGERFQPEQGEQFAGVGHGVPPQLPPVGHRVGFGSR